MKRYLPVSHVVAKLLLGGLALATLSGCGKVVEDMDQQLDRRQVDTYSDETPPPADAIDEELDADPSDGDEQIGRVEATGGE